MHLYHKTAYVRKSPFVGFSTIAHGHFCASRKGEGSLNVIHTKLFKITIFMSPTNI